MLDKDGDAVADAKAVELNVVVAVTDPDALHEKLPLTLLLTSTEVVEVTLRLFVGESEPVHVIETVAVELIDIVGVHAAVCVTVTDADKVGDGDIELVMVLEIVSVYEGDAVHVGLKVSDALGVPEHVLDADTETVCVGDLV